MTNSDQISGKAKQLAGKVKETWGRLTDNDVALLHGKRDQFFGRLQEAHGVAREEAEKQINAFERGFEEGRASEQQRRAS